MPRTPGKYGRRPNDPERYARALPLARVLTGVVPAHPAQQDYLSRLSDWKMLGNGPDPENTAHGVPADGAGDCVSVTWANTRRLVTAALAAEVYPDLDQVIALYKTQNPRFPSQDQGMVIETCLKYLVDHGGPDGVKALAYAKVDYTNPDEVKAATAIFGSVWVGLDVTAANEDEFSNEQPWDYVRRSQDLGGHSVVVGGYDSDGTGGDERFITWGEETAFTDQFWARQVSECWCVVWPEHLGSRAFLEGVDQQELADAYTELTGRPFPVQPQPVPPGPPVPDGPSAADVAAAVRQTLTDLGV